MLRRDKSGNNVATRYGAQNYSLHDYDVFGRLSKSYSFGDVFSYSYNNRGFLSNITSKNAGTTKTFNYDIAGRLSKTVLASTYFEQKFKYNYDSYDRLSAFVQTLTTNEGINDTQEHRFTYDNENRVTSESIIYQSGNHLVIAIKLKQGCKLPLVFFFKTAFNYIDFSNKRTYN